MHHKRLKYCGDHNTTSFLPPVQSNLWLSDVLKERGGYVSEWIMGIIAFTLLWLIGVRSALTENP